MSNQPLYPQTTTTTTQKFNVLAIVGFVLAFLINIVGAILSFVALSQIKRTGERGHGLALAGAIIGTVSFLLGVIGTVIALSAGMSHMG